MTARKRSNRRPGRPKTIHAVRTVGVSISNAMETALLDWMAAEGETSLSAALRTLLASALGMRSPTRVR